MKVPDTIKWRGWWKGWCGLLPTRLIGKTDPLVGLDIGSRAIKLIQLEQRDQGYRLHRCGLKRLYPGMLDGERSPNKSALVSAIKELFEECGVRVTRVAISISGPSVIIKRIRIPMMAMEEVEQYLVWNSQQYIPYDSDELYLDFHVVPQVNPGLKSTQLDLFLVAAKKDLVEQRRKLVENAGLDPVVCEVDSLALTNMYILTDGPNSHQTVLLVNIGASGMNMAVVRGGKPVLMRDASTGGDRYNDRIRSTLHCSEKRADQVLFSQVEERDFMPLLAEVHEEIGGEVKRTIEYLAETEPGGTMDKVLLCGGYARAPGLVESLSRFLGLPVEHIDPFHGVEVDESGVDRDALYNLAPLAAVGMGLASRRAGDR